jgi:hypothetical protein
LPKKRKEVGRDFSHRQVLQFHHQAQRAQLITGENIRKKQISRFIVANKTPINHAAVLQTPKEIIFTQQ